MPTSEALADTTAEAYRAALIRFKQRHIPAYGRDGVIQAYHAVRNMPYFSGPDRTPLTALNSGRGACTAKHIILRDLLRDLGYRASVELVDCDFARGVPVCDGMEPALRRSAERGGVRDIHCWVRLSMSEGSHVLDATWPDAVAAYGFPVNETWAGEGDTIPAAPGGTVREAPEDVAGRKAALLGEFEDDEIEVRRAFLASLSAWLENLPVRQGGGKK